MPRFDTLTPIHKALRALVYEVGGDLQTTDFADELEAAGAAADLELALHLMRDHHTTEEVYLYPKLQLLEEQLVATMLEQHGKVEQLLDVADAARKRVRAPDAEARTSSGADVNCRFNELVAFYLEHLAQEEAKVLPATWRHFDDAQLMAIQGTIIAEMDPDELFQWLAWMFKGLNRPELVGMLSGAKAGMPPEALDAVRELGAASMEPEAWQVVREQAGL
jgi:Hemerythrin HHE cation binding domain